MSSVSFYLRTKRFTQILIAALGLCFGCSRSDVLSPSKFTGEFTDALRQASPGLKVEVIQDLELKVTTSDGNTTTSFLNNAYDLYKHDPKAKDEVIQKYVAATLETLTSLNASADLDRTRIVPVIKDKAWLDDIRKSMKDRGAKEPLENVYEELNPDLIIVYAEDSPQNIRYFTPKDLEKAGIDQKNLRTLACENLKRLLPKIERYGTNGAYMFTAGGNYEASLLLLDSVWSDIQHDVSGDIVVAIPTRDVLLVTGSDDRDGLEKMRQTVKKISAQSAYKLTTKLFVRRDGNFVEFTGDSK